MKVSDIISAAINNKRRKTIMKMKVNAFMKESDGITPEQLEELKTFAGKNAGISQLRDGYFGTAVSDPKKAAPRFNATTKIGHTSIAGHAKIEVIFENTTRLFAMIMNSLQYYDTTEKSGRFTEMTGNNPEQCALYDKWNAIFKQRILEIHPDYNDAFITKQLKNKSISGFIVKNGRIYANDINADTENMLDITDDPDTAPVLKEIMDNPRLPVNTRSQENARYILSIFTKSTTFGYTTSLDQWNFIYDWCHKYMDQFGTKGDVMLRINKDGSTRPATWFEQNIYTDLSELANFIRENLYCPTIRDHKKRGFDMLTEIFDPDHPMQKYDHCNETIRFSYLTDYYASFIVLSHLDRHRTIKYWMLLDSLCKPGTYGFFIPPSIRDTNWEAEWLRDMESVKDLYPQGMMIHIIEAGTLDNFVLKTSERLCGCAMWETMDNVCRLAEKFAVHYESGNATDLEKTYIEKFYDPGTRHLRTKNTITDGCREGCYFGCGHALDRIV